MDTRAITTRIAVDGRAWHGALHLASVYRAPDVGLYATAEEVTAELAGLEGLSLPAGDALERLISSAERSIDGRLGPLEPDPIYGRKLPLVVDAGTGEVSLDPLLVTPAQRAAVVRAVAVAVAHLSELDLEQQLGLDDYAPALLTRLRGSGLAAVIDAQIAGYGLIARSGCALPDAEPDDLTV